MSDKVVEEITLSSDDEEVQVPRISPKQGDKKPQIIHLLPSASHPVIAPRRIDLKQVNGTSGPGPKSKTRRQKIGPKSKTRPQEMVQPKPKPVKVDVDEDEVILLDSDEDEDPKENQNQKITRLESEVKLEKLTATTQNGDIKEQLEVPNPLASSSQTGPSSLSSSQAGPSSSASFQAGPSSSPSSSVSIENGHSKLGDSGSYLPIGAHDFCSEAANEIKALLKRLRPRMTTKDFTRLQDKFWKKYHKLSAEPLDLHAKLQLKIAHTSEEVDKLPKDVFSWTLISNLWQYFNAEKLRKDEEENEEEIAERKRQEIINKKIKKLEKQMQETSKQIKRLDNKEVDFDDLENDHNSAYLVRDRLIARLMKVWNTLCSIKRCSKQTGRPVQKKLIVSNITIYEEFDKKVETYVNSQGYLFSPDFNNILSLLKEENITASLHLDDATLRRQAETLHKFVVDSIQKRRQHDTPLAFPAVCDDLGEDPANNDAELAAKLEENRRNAKTIKQVVDEFAAKQAAQNLQPEEVNDENVDNSPPASDNDEDDDDDDDNDDTSSVADSVSDQNLLDPDDKPADQEALFEDEEEEEDSEEVEIVDEDVEIVDEDVNGDEVASDLSKSVVADRSGESDEEMEITVQEPPVEVVEKTHVENKSSKNDPDLMGVIESCDGPPTKKVKLTSPLGKDVPLAETGDKNDPPAMTSVPDAPAEETNGVA